MQSDLTIAMRMRIVSIRMRISSALADQDSLISVQTNQKNPAVFVSSVSFEDRFNKEIFDLCNIMDLIVQLLFNGKMSSKNPRFYIGISFSLSFKISFSNFNFS